MSVNLSRRFLFGASSAVIGNIVICGVTLRAAEPVRKTQQVRWRADANIAADNAVAEVRPSDFPADGDEGGVANAVFVTSFENTAGCPMPCGDIDFPDCGQMASPACPAGCPAYAVGALVTSPTAGQNGWHAWTPASCPQAPSAAQDQISSLAAIVSGLHPSAGAQHLRFQRDFALPATPPSAGAISKLLAPSAVAASTMIVDVWINEPGICSGGPNAGMPCGEDGDPDDDCPGGACVGDGVTGSQYNFRPRDTAGSDTVMANVVFAPLDTIVNSTNLNTAGTTTVTVGTKDPAAMGPGPDVCVLVPRDSPMCNTTDLEFRCFSDYATNVWGRLEVEVDPIARTVRHRYYPDKTVPGTFFEYVSCDLVSADNVDSIHIRHNNTQNANEYMDVDNLAINIKLIPGACCTGGACANVTSNMCSLANGKVFLGPGTSCADVPAPCANGRCCNNVGGAGPDGACSYTTTAGCGAGSTYFGGFPNTTCNINCCSQPVTGADDPCSINSFPLVDTRRCVGGMNNGMPCGPAPGQPSCPGGVCGAVPAPRAFSGNTGGTANVQDCPALDMAAEPDGETRYHWEVFEITAPCVDLTIDYCCSGEETGEVRTPVANFLVKQIAPNCACDDADDFIAFNETGQSFGGTLSDECPEGNFSALIRSLGPGRYYFPIFVSDLSDDPDSIATPNDYQLHLRASACFTGGCCTGSTCSTTNAVACRNQNGTYLGNNVSCLIACGNGACCPAGGGPCANMTAAACGDTPSSGSTYFGGTTCTQMRCVGGVNPGMVCTSGFDCGPSGSGATCEGITCPPVNDKCSQAITLPTQLDFDFTTVAARTDGPNDECGTSPNLKNVWYNHTAACNGEVIISMCDPNFQFAEYDAVISVYTDTTCPIDPTTRVSCDDDGCGTDGSWSTTTFGATMGQMFKVRVGAFTDVGDSSQGVGEMDVTCGPSVCGNGAVGFGETCDDGNTMSGDGCSSTCQIDGGFPCTTSVDCRLDPDNNACNHAACTVQSCSYTCIRYGDVKTPQNNIVNLDDVLCGLAGFANPNNCLDADIAPCGGNNIYNIDDILGVLSAFAGSNPCGCPGIAPDCCPDCNSNAICDECDINCGPPDGFCDVPGCGGSEDCNANGKPDECEEGPCCIPGVSCFEDERDSCEAAGGMSRGPCDQCPPPVQVEEAVEERNGTTFYHKVYVTPECEPVPTPPGGALTDAWVTGASASDQLCQTFGEPMHPESPTIPAGFFGPGSDAFTGAVCLEGSPLGVPGFGTADTLVERMGDPFGPCALPPYGPPVAVPIEIVALNLVSVSPITVTYGGGMPELWGVRAGLSTAVPQPMGTLTATKTHCNGGTFTSTLPVRPKFTFTRLSDATVKTLDTGAAGIPATVLTQNVGGNWVHHVAHNQGVWVNPSSSFHPGVRQTNPTIACDANADGISDICCLSEADCDVGEICSPTSLCVRAKKCKYKVNAIVAPAGCGCESQCDIGEIDCGAACEQDSECPGDHTFPITCPNNVLQTCTVSVELLGCKPDCAQTCPNP